MGGGGDKLPGQYLGPWGNFGSPKQKGVTSYSLSANRQRPLAGALSAAIFNTWRRFRGQVLYFAPPLVIAYSVLSWAEEKNKYLNSKEGRMAHGEAAEEATSGGGGTVRG